MVWSYPSTTVEAVVLKLGELDYLDADCGIKYKKKFIGPVLCLIFVYTVTYRCRFQL